MKDEDKTKEKLLSELLELRQRISELEAAERERKRMEEELRESHERHRVLTNLIDSTSNPMTLYDSAGVLLLMNAAAATNLGGKPDDFVGKPIYEIHHESIADGEMDKIRQVVESGEETEFDSVFDLPSGRRWFWSNFQPVRDASGKIFAVQIISYDITERKRAEEALRESEERHRALCAASPDGVLMADIKTKKFTYANPATCKMLGYSEEELKRMDISDIHPKEALEHVISEFEAQVKGEKTLATDIPCLRKDGTIAYADINTTRVLIDGKECAVGFFRDITEHKQVEEALRESEEKYRSLVTNIPDVTWTTDSKGNTTFISPNVEKVYGYKPEEIYKEGERLWFGRIHPDNLEKVKQAFKALFEKGIRFDIEYRIKRKNGEWIWLEDKSITTYEKDGVMYADGLFSDITERKRIEETMRYLAYHDVLTGLPNPLVFNDRLAVALLHAERNQQNLAVMSLDLDRFKDVNDTLGHQVGDQLLKHVGRNLTNLLRKSDTVARMGGDEFMLLMPVIARVEDAHGVAQKVLEAFRKPFKFDEHAINITTSIGIAIYPNDGKDAGALIRNADAAMCSAKEKGRDNYQRSSSATDSETLE